MSDVTRVDRCQGVLLGLAAGDRNGGPVRMAVRLAESLVECGGFAPSDILERYLHWWREGAFDTGPVSDRALALIASGMPPEEAVLQVHREFGGKTAGCNPAHRSPPLAMSVAIADEEVAGFAMTEARLTHYDALAGEVAGKVSTLCRSLIRGNDWDTALRESGSSTGQAGPGNNGGYAPDVLRAALYFIDTSASFAGALERSLSFAGPANYCPVLVGAIGGARWGASAIPQRSLAHVDMLARVKATAETLAAEWAG